MNQDDLTAHPQGDFFNEQAQRFHNDLQNFSKQIAGCDKLVRMANISLNQIDARIAEAARLEAGAGQRIEETGREAARAATEAATLAVADLTGRLGAAVHEAEQVCQALNRSRGQTHLWIAFYAACTLTVCLLTAWVAFKAGKASQPDPVTPEMTSAIALGDKHQELLRKASDKEKRLINDILARRPKNKEAGK